MSPQNKKRALGSPPEWLSHAESDMKLARLAADDPDIRREQACFHAQQAVEKSIKAVLLSQHIEFPFTHDIEELLEIAENNGIAISEDIREAGSLNPYAVETRYPGYWLEISDAEITEAMRTAEQAIVWAKKFLESKGDE